MGRRAPRAGLRPLGALCRSLRSEERFGLAIEHPRYPVLPKFGMNAAPLLLFLAVLPALRRLQAEQDFS